MLNAPTMTTTFKVFHMIVLHAVYPRTRADIRRPIPRSSATRSRSFIDPTSQVPLDVRTYAIE